MEYPVIHNCAPTVGSLEMSTNLDACLRSLIGICTSSSKRLSGTAMEALELNLATPCSLAWMLAGSSHRMDWHALAGLGPKHSQVESFLVAAGLPVILDMFPLQHRLGWLASIACLSASLRGVLPSFPPPTVEGSQSQAYSPASLPLMLSSRVPFGSFFKDQCLRGGVGTPPLALLLLPSVMVPKCDIDSVELSSIGRIILLLALSKSLGKPASKSNSAVSSCFSSNCSSADMHMPSSHSGLSSRSAPDRLGQLKDSPRRLHFPTGFSST